MGSHSKSTVFIDPGHGGRQTGIVGPEGLEEKHVNLRVALLLAGMLEEKGINVEMSRRGDDTVTLAERVKMAGGFPGSIFVSIHHNANGQMDPTVNRSEVYYCWWVDGLSRRLASFLGQSFGKYLRIPCLQPRPALYKVLRDIPEPCVLGEACYLINPEWEEKLRDPGFLQREARAYYIAVTRFIRIRHLLEKEFNARGRRRRHGREPLGYLPLEPGTMPERDENLVIIDPGGREAYNPDMVEDFGENAAANLTVAKTLCGLLEKAGYRTLLTRKRNRGTVTPQRRARFIFVHAPACVIMIDHRYPLKDDGESGVFFFPGDSEGKRLASSVHARLRIPRSDRGDGRSTAALSPFTHYLMIQSSAPRIMVVPSTLGKDREGKVRTPRRAGLKVEAEVIFEGFSAYMKPRRDSKKR